VETSQIEVNGKINNLEIKKYLQNLICKWTLILSCSYVNLARKRNMEVSRDMINISTSLKFRGYRNFSPCCFCLKCSNLYKNDIYDRQNEKLSMGKVKGNEL